MNCFAPFSRSRENGFGTVSRGTGVRANIIRTTGGCEEGYSARGISGPIDGPHGRKPTSARGRPPFSEFARLRLIDLPIEEIVIAGPGVDFDPANLAGETAGMPA